MIEQTISYLCDIMSEKFSNITGIKHKFKDVYTNLDDASKSIGDNKSKSVSGYVRFSNIQNDTNNRKIRNSELVVSDKDNDMSYVVKILPVKVELECKVSLYKGHPHFYKLLPAIAASQLHGFLDFEINWVLGSQKISTSVQVGYETFDAQMPEFSTEVEEGESALIFNLTMKNLFLLTSNKVVPNLLNPIIELGGI